jgi:class 3 adenylate cyclase
VYVLLQMYLCQISPITIDTDSHILQQSLCITVADITGFTAWCSSREPTQVFTLLESIYSVYDTLAKKRKVFKVETIGDCYMAVTGLPEPRADHAVIMCRFARQCLSKLHALLADLEVTLGPGAFDINYNVIMGSNRSSCLARFVYIRYFRFKHAFWFAFRSSHGGCTS